MGLIKTTRGNYPFRKDGSIGMFSFGLQVLAIYAMDWGLTYFIMAAIYSICNFVFVATITILEIKMWLEWKN